METTTLLILGSIIGFILVCLIIAYLFNPTRVTSDRIVATPKPADISIEDGEFVVQPVKFGHVNVYLIATENGYILVDVGMPNTEKQLGGVFEKIGVDPQSVQLIILTHGHMDHIGSIAHAKRITGGEVLCHQTYAQSLENGEIEPATTHNFTGRFLNFVTGLLGTSFEGVKPDIVISDEYDLSEYGVAGKVIYTPGHSPSSLSVLLENGEALIGDIVREEKPSVVDIGIFYENKLALIESLEKIAAFNSSIFYLSHGTYIDRPTLIDAIERIKAKSEN
jgi:glyoxylase-like metal-dependent hydrolase (beta-lactamase superfamily II)